MVKICLSLEGIITIWNKLRFFLYFFDFIKVTHKVFRGSFSTHPLFGFLNYLLNYVELDYFLNILAVVGALEDCELGVIFEF